MIVSRCFYLNEKPLRRLKLILFLKLLGADGVWVGTRFVCATEAGASPNHQQEIISADFDSTFRTLFYTGRPLRVKKKKTVLSWETEKREGKLGEKGVIFFPPTNHFSFLSEMNQLLSQGTIPFKALEKKLVDAGDEKNLREVNIDRRLLMGQVRRKIIKNRDVFMKYFSFYF